MFKGKLENMSGCSDSNNDVRCPVIGTFPQWFSSMALQSFIDGCKRRIIQVVLFCPFTLVLLSIHEESPHRCLNDMQKSLNREPKGQTAAEKP